MKTKALFLFLIILGLNCYAQNEKFDLLISLQANVGFINYTGDQDNLIPPADFKTKLDCPANDHWNSIGYLTKIDKQVSFAFETTIEPTIKIKNNLIIGIPIHLNCLPMSSTEAYSKRADDGKILWFDNRVIAKTTYFWWGEKDISILEISQHRNNPAIGISIKSRPWRFQYTIQKEHIKTIDYKATANIGDWWGTEKPYNYRNQENRFNHRMEATYYIYNIFDRTDKYAKQHPDNHMGISIITEFDAKNYFALSIGVRHDFVPLKYIKRR